MLQLCCLKEIYTQIMQYKYTPSKGGAFQIKLLRYFKNKTYTRALVDKANMNAAHL